MFLRRLLPENLHPTLLAVVLAATLLPASCDIATLIFERITNLAIALLFFMHGAKLSRQAILAGAGHWRLHLLVFACTFILFPLLGLALRPALEPLLELYLGMLYLCALPATVQSAIAFTSLARGNIPAAICSAAASPPASSSPPAGGLADGRARRQRLDPRRHWQDQPAVAAAVRARPDRSALDGAGSTRTRAG